MRDEDPARVEASSHWVARVRQCGLGDRVVSWSARQNMVNSKHGPYYYDHDERSSEFEHNDISFAGIDGRGYELKHASLGAR